MTRVCGPKILQTPYQVFTDGLECKRPGKFIMLPKILKSSCQLCAKGNVLELFEKWTLQRKQQSEEI